MYYAINVKDLILLTQLYMTTEKPTPKNGKQADSYIELCDQVPGYWMVNLSLSNPWCTIETFMGRQVLYPEYMGTQYPYDRIKAACAGDQACLEDVEKIGDNPKYWLYVGEDDDFKAVADFWVPNAIRLSAAVIAKFFIDVGEIKKVAIGKPPHNLYTRNRQSGSDKNCTKLDRFIMKRR
jgi:hypothetical protein